MYSQTFNRISSEKERDFSLERHGLFSVAFTLAATQYIFTEYNCSRIWWRWIMWIFWFIVTGIQYYIRHQFVGIVFIFFCTKKKKKIIESIRCGLFSFNIYLVAIAIPIPHSDHVAEASKRYIPKL